MTYFEKNLINNLNITQKANDIIGVNTFDSNTIHNIVIKTLINCRVNFFEDGEEVTEHAFPKQLQKGSTFYWLCNNTGEIDEFILSKVVYRKYDNEQQFPFEVYVKDGNDEYSAGWEECQMRINTMQTLFENLPDELQAVIKTVNKKATAGSYSTSIVISQDKLWLYSEVELDGTSSSGYKDEGTQYEYWQSHNTNSDRVKNLNNGSGSANYYWLRSPNTGGSSNFRRISSDGNVGYSYASDSYGVCFGFCI